MTVAIEILKTNNKAILPKRAHDTDAGWDVFCPEDFELLSGERKKIGMGYKIGIVPEKITELSLCHTIEDEEFGLQECYFNEKFVWQIEVRPRSGLAINHGVTVLNSPGTIDNGYRGEFCVIIINHGDEHLFFKEGDKIAQILLTRSYICDIVEVNSFSDKTKRNEGGFGSTK